MSQRILDALLHSWPSGEERQFKEIHTSFQERGIVKYNFQTVRILTRAERLGFIKKLDRGRYQSNVEPDEFRVFDYLNALREKSQIARGRIGGALWSSHDLYFLGMPDRVFDDKEGNYVLQILNVRLAELFNAFKALAIEMKIREEGHQEGQLSGLPRTVVRQLLLELIPYYLGSRAGIDFDGLNMDELKKALPVMIQALPQRIEDEEGWSASTLKEIIRENFDVINKFGLLYTSNKKRTYRKDGEAAEEIKEDIEEEEKQKNQDFALIVTGPEHLIDSQGYAQREIREEIIEHGNEDESPFYLARFLLDQKREDVLKTLRVCGRKQLGQERCNRTRDAYEKLYAANWLAQLITESNTRACLKEKPFTKREKSGIDENITKIIHDFGFKTVITCLPLSNSSMCFGSPTAEKEKAIQQFFPQVPAENIHQWLTEGVALFERFADKIMEKWKEKGIKAPSTP